MKNPGGMGFAQWGREGRDWRAAGKKAMPAMERKGGKGLGMICTGI